MPGSLDLDQQVCFPLYAASNLLGRLYRPVLEPLELTYPQYLVMLCLWQDAPQSIGDLGARLYLDSGTLTPLVKRLAAAGFVTRERDPADERRVLVSPTETGQALRAVAECVPETLMEELPMPPADVERMRMLVQKLVSIMSEALVRKDRGHGALHAGS